MSRDVGRRVRVGGWLAVAVLAAGLSVGRESRVLAQGQGQAQGTAAGRRVPDALRFAHGLLRQGKYELAAEEYERFLASGSPTAADRGDALYGLANARLNQERYADSLRAFSDFLAAAAPGDARASTARYRVGELSYITGDMPAARRALETFTAGKADHPAMETAWTYLGDVDFSQNDLPAARKAYERSLADHPRGRLADRARYGLGRTLAALGERDRAIQVLRELAARGGPDWADRAWYQVGTIELAASRPAEAVEAFEAMERAAPSSPLRGEARLRRARALGRLGRTDDAARLLAGLIADAANPQAPQSALELATIEMQRRRPEAALAAVEVVLKRYPRSPARPALLFRSAEALRELHRAGEAEARFLQVAETAPDDPWADDALARAAASALERKDAAAARRIAARLATRYPSSPLKGDARLIEARAAAMVGEPKAAVEILERLLGTAGAGDGGAEKLPLSPAATRDARYELALAYRAVGRPDDAEKLLADLAGEPAGPLAADAQFLLGQSHLEAGRFAEAIPPLEGYLAAQPRGEVAEFALADLVAAQVGVKRLDDAGRALETLARQFPHATTLPGARVRHAEAALAAGQFERAVEQFRLAAGSAGVKPAASRAGAAAIEPAIRMRAFVGLGRALEAMGQHAEAAEAFASAGALLPAGDASAFGLAGDRARALEAANRSDDALAA
ncbi:MAG: tetratricopeptide repeat protein, partial [Isosphaeraceae bacterium]